MYLKQIIIYIKYITHNLESIIKLYLKKKKKKKSKKIIK